MKTKLIWFTAIGLVLWMVWSVYAATFDATKSAGSLLDWTEMANATTVESGELDSGEGLNASIQAVLHIDMCASTATAATVGSGGFVVFIKAGTTDEDWQEFVRCTATGGTANVGDLDDAAASAQAVIPLTSTTNFETPGDVYFLQDETTIADSCLVIHSGTYNDDVSITVIDNLVNAYDNADNLYDLVDQWSIRLPSATAAAKVLFYNTDADSDYACRVRYSLLTDMDDG